VLPWVEMRGRGVACVCVGFECVHVCVCVCVCACVGCTLAGMVRPKGSQPSALRGDSW
jgi:hypothetical protein